MEDKGAEVAVRDDNCDAEFQREGGEISTEHGFGGLGGGQSGGRYLNANG